MSDETNIVEMLQNKQPPTFSDSALALRYVNENTNLLRYVHSHRRWYHWDSTRWSYDCTQLAEDLAKEICTTAADTKHERVASAGKVAAVVRLASMDRRIATTNDVFDTEDQLLNTHHKTINLQTGRDYPPQPGEYLTKIAGTVAKPMSCPIWTAFLDRITAGDAELQEYLQRVCGYCLSGHTSEHVFFFSWGSGANGKSVFWNTISRCMGDYAANANIDQFIESRNTRHPTEWARLDGVRLILCSETSSNTRWNEGKIKAVTGGEKIAARFMGMDFFEFVPRFKLSAMGNRKPSLHTVDEAMRRRLHLIPFTVTIPVAERDIKLPEKLQAEAPGILQWAIEGAAKWYATGLEAPTVVTHATDAYLKAEDTFGSWQDECIETNYELAQHWETSKALFTSWKTWAEDNGEWVGTQKAFAQQLEAHGAMPKRTSTARGYTGFRLL